MIKGTRVKYKDQLGTVVNESGFINVFRNKLMVVRFDSEPNSLFYKDETELEII